jgi:hypothetical protein
LLYQLYVLQLAADAMIAANQTAANQLTTAAHNLAVLHNNVAIKLNQFTDNHSHGYQ